MQKNARETRVVFRLDDVSASSDHAVEQILFETFFESGIPLTVGAIPFLCDGDVHDPAAEGELPLPQEKLAFLAERRARGGLEVAQHGCSHQVRSGVGYRTEFCGRPVSEQRAVIARGKALLEGYFPVNSFIPPWNSYDEATLQALAELGFEVLSADVFGPLRAAGGLQFLPSTTSLGQLSRALEAAGNARASRAVIVVLLHAYDFRESGSARATMAAGELKDLLEALPRDSGFRFLTLEGCAAEGGGYSAGALRRARQRARIARHLPSFVRRAFAPEGVALYSKDRTLPRGAHRGSASTE